MAVLTANANNNGQTYHSIELVKLFMVLIYPIKPIHYLY